MKNWVEKSLDLDDMYLLRYFDKHLKFSWFQNEFLSSKIQIEINWPLILERQIGPKWNKGGALSNTLTNLFERSSSNYLKSRELMLPVTWPATGSDDLNFQAIYTVSAHWNNKTFKFCRSLLFVIWHIFFYKITTLAFSMQKM